MGDIWQQDKLLLFLAFFIPGFIAMQVYGLFIATGDRDFTKQLPEAIAYSAIHYALFGWLILVNHGVWRTVAAYIVVLILPIFWPPAILLIRDWKRYSPRILSRKILGFLIQPTASPWDHVFSESKERWIRIKLKSGQYVGGLLARGSWTSTYPSPEQIYISKEFRVDANGFQTPYKKSEGLLVNGTEIEYLELYSGEEKKSERR